MKLAKSLAVIATTSLSLSGCYTLEPAAGATPLIGQEYAFDVNDVGRVALGGSMGPEISQVQGTVVSQHDSIYMLSVRQLTMIGGGTQVWKGERVELKTQYIKSMYERKYSRTRTVLVGAIAAAGLALLATRSLSAGGVEDVGGTPPPTGTALRVP